MIEKLIQLRDLLLHLKAALLALVVAGSAVSPLGGAKLGAETDRVMAYRYQFNYLLDGKISVKEVTSTTELICKNEATRVRPSSTALLISSSLETERRLTGDEKTILLCE